MGRGTYKKKAYSDYRAWLVKAGYAPKTVREYICGISRFNGDLNDESIDSWLNELVASGVDQKRANGFAQGVKRYKNFLDGVEVVNNYRKFRCDDDCFNCRYSDCMKPDYLCLSTEVKKC